MVAVASTALNKNSVHSCDPLWRMRSHGVKAGRVHLCRVTGNTV